MTKHGLFKSLRLVKFVHSLIRLIILLTPKFDCFLVLWKLLLIGLAGCGIGLFFVVILGMGTKNRSGMREF